MALQSSLSNRSSIVVAMICILASISGCSAIRQRRQQQVGLATARQFSLRGVDALQQQKFEDAEALFSESLRHSPMDERAQWGMAEVLYQRGDRSKAAQCMQEAAKMSGNNPDLAVRLGQMLIDEGKIDQAIAQADIALSLDWQHAGAWELRGRGLEAMEKNNEALEAYHRALMTQPNNPQVQLALAALYQRDGRPQRALATLERMSDLRNAEYQSAMTWVIKGAALASLGQSNESRQCLRQASQLAAPQDHRFHLQLAQLQSQNGDLAEARASLGHALNQQPNDPWALQIQSQLEQQFRELAHRTDTTPAIDTVPLATVAGALIPPSSQLIHIHAPTSTVPIRITPYSTPATGNK